jgi:SAM-dependent methyltransferase
VTPDLVDVRGTFATVDQWKAWSGALGDFTAGRQQILDEIRRHGLVEPITGIRRSPRQITIDEDNLHESVSCSGLNARKRALLLQIAEEIKARGWQGRRDLRILGAEALSRVALALRGRHPYYLGTEYLPRPEDRARHFPIPHLDLQDIGFADASFDLFVSGDVFEHIPDLDRALGEILRVLKPGGMIVSSFPFSPGRLHTIVRASPAPDGGVVHHLPPLHHGNPVDPEAGSLVFQYPGWDLLAKLRAWGCSEAYYSTIASAHFGVVASQHPGPFILTARKAGGVAEG